MKSNYFLLNLLKSLCEGVFFYSEEKISQPAQMLEQQLV